MVAIKNEENIMEINGYILVNTDKVKRAIYGTISSGGMLTGGVGENASDMAKLVEYDRLGGLITKGGYKVKTGSFYDFQKGKARVTPEVNFIFRDLNGEAVEVPEGEELPLEVKAAQIAAKKPKKLAKPKRDED